jgi:hypothetical protein
MSIDSFFYVPAGTRDLEPGKQDYKKYRTVSDFVAAHGDRPFPHQVATGARRQEDLEHASQQGKDDNCGKKATHSIAEYAEARSFGRLADRHGIHRPEIRRAFRRAAERLETGDREQQALAAWIRALIDRANPFGEGESKRQAAKRGDVFVRTTSGSLISASGSRTGRSQKSWPRAATYDRPAARMGRHPRIPRPLRRTPPI